MGEAFAAAFGRMRGAPTARAGAGPMPQTSSPSAWKPDERPLYQKITMDEAADAAVPPRLEEFEHAAHTAAPPFARPTADFSAISPGLTYLRQVFQSYLLCVEGQDLFIIDQHALHERLLYDELVARESRSDATTQGLLIPITFELAPDRAEALAAHLEMFVQVGIEIEPFGPRTFAITALARLHAEKSVIEGVLEGIDELFMGLRLKAPREILLRLMTISACKNSIKAGDRLTDAEAEMLIEGLKNLAQPPTCLHGRPLALRLSESQIARAFGRKG
jgi:DNA mismatch repair ATPase MutL